MSLLVGVAVAVEDGKVQAAEGDTGMADDARVESGATVVVVGSANADLVVRVGRHPRPGETVLGSDLEVHPGGKGANQAVAAARLGARVAMVGRVGSDPYGAVLLNALTQNGVDISAVRCAAAAPTGVALITVGEGGENAIVVAPGANARLSESDVIEAMSRFGHVAVLLAQLEVPSAAVVAAARCAEARGIRLVLNAAPADALIDARLAGEVLPLCDPLVVNEHEAAVLTGRRGDPVRSLLDRGVRSVVVTLGRHGAAVAEASEAEDQDSARPRRSGASGGFIGPLPEGPDPRSRHPLPGMHVPGVAVETVDTTGAGDAFMGALAWCLSADGDLVDAVRWAVRAGAAAVRAHGAQSAYPRADELLGL